MENQKCLCFTCMMLTCYFHTQKRYEDLFMFDILCVCILVGIELYRSPPPLVLEQIEIQAAPLGRGVTYCPQNTNHKS